MKASDKILETLAEACAFKYKTLKTRRKLNTFIHNGKNYLMFDEDCVFLAMVAQLMSEDKDLRDYTAEQLAQEYCPVDWEIEEDE